MTVTNRTVRTSHGDIAISETAGKGLPVLLLHGNSSCKEAFSKQLDSALGEEFHMIAMDLPGHGASSPAIDPANTYSLPGYAEAAVELLGNIGVSSAAVCGWSLGGHVAMELLGRFAGISGLMIMGAPPVGPEMGSIQQGFQPCPAMALSWQETWTDEEFQAFSDAVFGGLDEPELRQAGRHTDGAARRYLAESLMSGRALDERPIVARSDVPIAVVNGADDPIVNLDYIGSLPYGNLWDKHCFILRGIGHMPFREAPEVFNTLLGRFLKEVASRKRPLARQKASATKTHAA